MLLDLRSLEEKAIVRVGGGYPRAAPQDQQWPIPAYKIDPAIWLVLYAANAIDEDELAALLAAT